MSRLRNMVWSWLRGPLIECYFCGYRHKAPHCLASLPPEQVVYCSPELDAGEQR